MPCLCLLWHWGAPKSASCCMTDTNWLLCCAKCSLVLGRYVLQCLDQWCRYADARYPTLTWRTMAGARPVASNGGTCCRTANAASCSRAFSACLLHASSPAGTNLGACDSTVTAAGTWLLACQHTIWLLHAFMHAAVLYAGRPERSSGLRRQGALCLLACQDVHHGTLDVSRLAQLRKQAPHAEAGAALRVPAFQSSQCIAQALAQPHRLPCRVVHWRAQLAPLHKLQMSGYGLPGAGMRSSCSQAPVMYCLQRLSWELLAASSSG